MPSIRRYASVIPGWLLLIVSILVAAALIAHRLFNFGISTETMILVMLEALAFSIGLERVTSLHRNETNTAAIASHIPSIANSLSEFSKRFNAQLLTDTDLVFRSTLPLIRASEHSIKVVGHFASGPAPEYWIDCILSHLKQRIEQGRMMKWEVKLFLNMAIETADTARIFDDRISKIKTYGVSAAVEWTFFHSEQPGLDLLLIDGKSVTFRFPRYPRQPQSPLFGIMFDNAPSLAAEIEHWCAGLGRGLSIEDLLSRSHSNQRRRRVGE